MTEPCTADWIDAEAQRMERAANAEIRTRWPKHSQYTRDAMVTEVAEKHLNGLWEYMVASFSNAPDQIRITRYLGPVDESTDR